MTQQIETSIEKQKFKNKKQMKLLEQKRTEHSKKK